jgi:hypothetical protein
MQRATVTETYSLLMSATIWFLAARPCLTGCAYDPLRRARKLLVSRIAQTCTYLGLCKTLDTQFCTPSRLPAKLKLGVKTTLRAEASVPDSVGRWL